MFGDGDLADERAPLLQFPGQFGGQTFAGQEALVLPDAYKQFCHLVGKKPLDHPPKASFTVRKDSLYYRATERRKTQGRMYAFASMLTNVLLLSQIILGAALTGLGASKSSPILITLFGATNTIIAGVIAFMKSRGQPHRARMFRNDLDRVVDEIENSATMWRGISQKAHGYDAIDTDEAVTVRSEVARLTRLYDRAVKTSTMNDPDFYGAGISPDGGTSGLRNRADLFPTSLPQLNVVPDPPVSVPTAPVASASADPDESPATKVPAPGPAPKEDDKPADPPAAAKPAEDNTSKAPEAPKPAEPAATPAPAPIPAPEPSSSSSGPPPPAPTPAAEDPDASPATASKPPMAKRASTSPKSPEEPPVKHSEDLNQADGGASRSS